MTTRLVQGAVALVAVVVLWQWGATSCALQAARAEATAEQLRADSLAGEAAAARAEADGWAVRLGTSDPDALAAEIEVKDSTLARLGQDLTASRVRVTELVRLVTEAEGEVRTVADTVVIVEDQVESFAGRFDDGYLSALWRADVARTALELDYATRDTIRLLRGVTGDSRLWFSARPTHPNARASVDTLFVDLPEPEVIRKNSLGRRVVDVLIGAAGGVVLCAAAC